MNKQSDEFPQEFSYKYFCLYAIKNAGKKNLHLSHLLTHLTRRWELFVLSRKNPGGMRRGFRNKCFLGKKWLNKIGWVGLELRDELILKVCGERDENLRKKFRS